MWVTKKKKRTKKVKRLVSYQDDSYISDEDEPEPTSSSEESETDELSSKIGSGDTDTAKPMEVEERELQSAREGKEATANLENAEKYSKYSFSLPQEPKGKPAPELVDKIRHLYEKMQKHNMDMNHIIQGRKEFRNPSIYEKLIQFCDINELGTNYPPELYDPLRWGAESYYEELARVQKDEMVKRQKKRKDNDKIEHATALARKVEEEAKKRKSKWDQPAPVKPTLTTTVTGTKGTVLSAFGSLPKKQIN